jgi:hypothetical protein
MARFDFVVIGAGAAGGEPYIAAATTRQNAAGIALRCHLAMMRSSPAASAWLRMADYLIVSVPSASVLPSLVNVNLYAPGSEGLRLPCSM